MSDSRHDRLHDADRTADERFYEVMPQHVLDGHRFGSELEREISATEGLVRWHRHALRRSCKDLRRLSTMTPEWQARTMENYATRHRDYREAMARLTELMNQRWQNRLTELRAAE
jgi:hypothetical protein